MNYCHKSLIVEGLTVKAASGSILIVVLQRRLQKVLNRGLRNYKNSVDEIDDKDIIEEIDGYDTMFRDFCDGYDNFEQWAECNLI